MPPTIEEKRIQPTILNRSLSKLHFLVQGRTIALLSTYKATKASRNLAFSTVGFVTGAGDETPKALAVSGWKRKQQPETCLLNNAAYTSMVRSFCQLIRFKLPQFYRDTRTEGPCEPAMCGRWYASHTEKQLALYWLRRQLTFYFGSPEYANMEKLKTMDLPASRKRAAIYIDHKPCSNCLAFIDAIVARSGLEISVVPRLALRLGRRAMNGCKNCNYEACRKAFEAKPAPGVYDLAKYQTGSANGQGAGPSGTVEATTGTQDGHEEGFGRLSVRSTPPTVVSWVGSHHQGCASTTAASSPRPAPGPVSVPDDWRNFKGAAKPLPATPVTRQPSLLAKAVPADLAGFAHMTILPSVEQDEEVKLEYATEACDSETSKVAETMSPSVRRERELRKKKDTGRPARIAKFPIDLETFRYSRPAVQVDLTEAASNTVTVGTRKQKTTGPKKKWTAATPFAKSTLPGQVRVAAERRLAAASMLPVAA